MGPRCVPVDFCEKCYENLGREHASHCLIRADAGVEGLKDFEWVAARNPRVPKPAMDPELLQQMQERELTDDDYDTLLNLDKEELPDLVDHLLSTFPKKLLVGPCALCMISDFEHHSIQCQLPCGHGAHQKCLSSKTTEALCDGGWKLQSIKCNVQSCVYPHMYLGLSRKRRKSRERSDSQTAEDIPKTKAEANRTLEGCFGVSGLNLVGRGAATGKAHSDCMAERTRSEAPCKSEE